MNKYLLCTDVWINIFSYLEFYNQNDYWKIGISPTWFYTSISFVDILKKNHTYSKSQTCFTKQVPVPQKIVKFLKLKPNKEFSRMDIIRMIYAYINKNDRHRPYRTLYINPDDKLQKLFNLTGRDKYGLTYYNFPKYLAKLYKKACRLEIRYINHTYSLEKIMQEEKKLSINTNASNNKILQQNKLIINKQKRELVLNDDDIQIHQRNHQTKICKKNFKYETYRRKKKIFKKHKSIDKWLVNRKKKKRKTKEMKRQIKGKQYTQDDDTDDDDIHYRRRKKRFNKLKKKKKLR
jgi:hypothetical protein